MFCCYYSCKIWSLLIAEKYILVMLFRLSLLHRQNVDLPRLFSGENKPYKLVSFFHPVVTFSVELPVTLPAVTNKIICLGIRVRFSITVSVRVNYFRDSQ